MRDKLAHKRLLSLIGKEAYDSLKRGGMLIIWRRSTPHNWWIEGKRGKQYWHSDEFDKRRPDLRLFEAVSESPHKVFDWMPHGISEETRYKLRG